MSADHVRGTKLEKLEAEHEALKQIHEGVKNGLKEELKCLNRENLELQDKCEYLENQLKLAAENKSLKDSPFSTREKLTEREVELKQNILSLEKELEASEQALTKERDENQKLKNENAILQEALFKKESELRIEREQCTQFNNQWIDCKNELTTIREEVLQIEKELKQLSEENKGLEKNLNTAHEETETLTNQVNDLREAISVLKDNVKTVESKREFDEMREKLMRYRETFCNQERNLILLQNQNDELLRTIEKGQKQSELTKENVENDQTKQKLADYEREIVEKNEIIDQFVLEVSMKDNTIIQLRDKNKKLEEDLKAKEKEINTRIMQLRNFKEEISLLSEKLRKKRTQYTNELSEKDKIITQLTDKIASMEEDLRNKQTENESLKNQFDKLKGGLTDFNQNLKTIDSSTNECGRLSQKLAQCTEKLSEKEKRLTQLENEKAKCEHDLKNYANGNEQFRNQLSDLNEKITALERDNLEKNENINLITSNKNDLEETLKAEQNKNETLTKEVTHLEHEVEKLNIVKPLKTKYEKLSQSVTLFALGVSIKKKDLPKLGENNMEDVDMQKFISFVTSSADELNNLVPDAWGSCLEQSTSNNNVGD